MKYRTVCKQWIGAYFFPCIRKYFWNFYIYKQSAEHEQQQQNKNERISEQM